MPRIGRIARRLIADGGRDAALALHTFGGELVDFRRGHAGADGLGQLVEHFRGQTAGDAHVGDVFGGFDKARVSHGKKARSPLHSRQA